MTSVRTVRPTDLAALVAYDGRVYPNESVTRDRLGTEASPHPLGTALEQWFSFATGRHTWISVKGATLRGLVSARKRATKAAWEVDCLIDATEDDSGVMLSLLDKVTADAGKAGAEKIFLRVGAESDAVKRACSCGFLAYTTERLMVARQNDLVLDDIDQITGLRRWTKADAYPTFQLYNRWAPEQVRRVEAATFKEWQAARERVSAGRATRQRVGEDDGRVVGWLRTSAAGGIGRFDIMADPSKPGLTERLADAAIARLQAQEKLITLVPDFATGLQQHLEMRGFEERDEYTVLAKRTLRTVPVPELAPATPT